MKKLIIFALLLIVNCQLSTVNCQRVERVDPTDWFVGMQDPTVQLMVYGQGIRDAEVSIDYAGVSIDSIVRLDSPNYLLLYLDLRGAKAGTMDINFKLKGKKTTYAYTLKNREKAGSERRGFTNADVLYMLMPDRFAQGPLASNAKMRKSFRFDRSEPSLRHGGNLSGIRQHLDYFNELGVTALWLTPVLENDSPDENGFSTYHGYATTDYYRVDPRFGTNADYRALVDDAHRHGLKVVMDMIFNHCGFDHPWVADMPSDDWFNLHDWLKKSGGTSVPNDEFLQTSYKLTPIVDPYASKVDLHETVEGWFVPTMPDLNQRNPHVMRYLTQNSEWWIETVGIDGIRMDTYPYADRHAMATWMRTLEREYPNFNTVGETWVTEPAYTASWQKGSRLVRPEDDSRLPTVMDFAFFDRLNSAKHEETDPWWNGFNRLYNSFVYDYLYENPRSVMAFIDNHDTDRYLGNGCDTLSLKQALALLLTIQRIPQLYYGTEVLMNGTKEVTDGNVRKDFPGGFPGDAHNCFTADGRSDAQNAMFQWLSRLLHWRQGNAAIIEGTQTQFIPWKGVYVIARQSPTKTVLTVLNGTSKPATMDVSRYAEVIAGAQSAVDIPTGQRVSLADDLTLSPRQTLVLELAR